MKITATFLLIFISVITFSQFDYATKDYIIDINNDTIYGQIYNSKSGVKIEFRNEDFEKKIKAYDMLGYKKGINEFKVKNIDNIPKFVKVLIEDYVSLYVLNSYVFDPNATFLIEKGDTIVQIDKRFKFNKTISTLFSDYPELAESVKKRSYSYADMPEIIRQYNYWVENDKVADKELAAYKYWGYSKGYVVLSENQDTINGYIKPQTNNSILFIDNAGEETDLYKNEMIAFSFNNKTYIKTKVNNQKFLQELCSGEISLYKSNTLSPGSYSNQTGTYTGGGEVIDYYILRKGDTKAVKLSKKNLLDHFTDNNYLKEKIESGYYLLSDIETIVYIYNNSK